jgi:predicted transcriptional regulator YdeE/DNA-binding transcriptional MerR regulator
MLKIGDFSRLAHVSIKALRHYDRLELLRPVYIDRFTGYRYYDIKQLPRLNRILALKEMDFSLAQISNLLETDLPVAQLQALFDRKQQELQHRLAKEQSRLKRVAEILAQIEQEGCLPSYDVTLKPVPPMLVASIRDSVERTSLLERHFERMQEQIRDWAFGAGARGREQWLILYHHPGYRQRDLDVEVALVLESAAVKEQASQTAPLLAVRWLPGVDRMAGLLHTADAQFLHATYADLSQWIERSGYFIAGPAREVRLSDSAMEDSGHSFVEVQLPIENVLEVRKKLYENPYRKENEMEPRIVSLSAFKVVGMRYYGKNENQEIAQMWGEFSRRRNEIPDLSDEPTGYGLCISDPEKDTDGAFEYIACLKVDRFGDLPEGMVSREIPAYTYAIFAHIGALDKLSDTYQYIYQVWLPQSGYKMAAYVDFEYYDEDFKDFAPDSRLYIYVPIEKVG